MEQQIITTIAKDTESYSGPFFHPDDFAQDRISTLALQYSEQTLAHHRREVARRYEEIRRSIRMGIPFYLQENSYHALSRSLDEWDDYINVARREQHKARERLLSRPLLDRLLDLLDERGLRYRCGHRVRRNLLVHMDDSLQTLPEDPLLD